MSTFSVPPTAPDLPVFAAALPASTAAKATTTVTVDSHSILLKECSFPDFTERAPARHPVNFDAGIKRGLGLATQPLPIIYAA